MINPAKLQGFREEPPSSKHWSFEDNLRSQARHVYADPDIVSAAEEPDLRPHSGARHDQRSSNSCVAQATVKALEIRRAFQYGPSTTHPDLSRLHVYFLARELMFPPETSLDEGTYVSHAFDAIRRFGICAEEVWPFDLKKIFTSPSWKAMRKAYTNKISAFYKIYEEGADRVDAVIDALRAGYPVVFGTNIDRRWTGYEAGEVLTPVSRAYRTGRHATVLVGWVGGVFIGENSWGLSWGDNGFYRMAPEVIASEVSADFWVATVGGEP